MTATARRDRASRAPLSRDRVIDAAISLADAEGADALSMRRIARELGVEAMTLYHHVANKDEIVHALIDRVMGEFELPSTDADWKPAVRASAISAYHALSRHPWAAGLMLSSKVTVPARLAHMESLLATLRRAGLSDDLADLAYHAVEGHVMGFTLWEVGIVKSLRGDLKTVASEFLANLPTDQFPHIAEHIRHHLRPRPADATGEFEFGLDLILDGLERLAAESH